MADSMTWSDEDGNLRSGTYDEYLAYIESLNNTNSSSSDKVIEDFLKLNFPSVVFTSNAKLSSVTIKKGQIIFVKDTKKIYVDIDNSTRLDLIGNAITTAKSETKSEMVIGPVSFSISTSSWSSVSNSGYSYRASISNSKISSSDSADVRFALASIATCQTAQVAPACETYSGGIYLYSKTIPAATITGVYIVQKPV